MEVCRGLGRSGVTDGEKIERAVQLTVEGLGSTIPAVARAGLRQSGSERFLAAQRIQSAAWLGLWRGGKAWPRRRSALLCSAELRGVAARVWGGAWGGWGFCEGSRGG